MITKIKSLGNTLLNQVVIEWQENKDEEDNQENKPLVPQVVQWVEMVDTANSIWLVERSSKKAIYQWQKTFLIQERWELLVVILKLSYRYG